MKLRHSDLDEVVHDGPGAEAAFDAVRDMVQHFTLYGPTIMRVELPPEGVHVNLVFVQHLRMGPFTIRGPVKVLRTWSEATGDQARHGFEYEAQQGHVEAGTATFEAIRDGDQVRLRIASRSAPALWYVKLGYPVARMMQARAVRTAFRRAREAAPARH